jgi:hypothetical protein
MTPSSTRALRALTRESLADAMRRRIVPAIAVAALLSLLFVDSCTSCAPAVTRDGQIVEIPQVAGWSGVVILVSLGLWTLVLAGLVAADHLREALGDGSASLVLARPVGRGTFAVARLGGALAIAWATGAVLLLGSAGLVSARHGLPLAPAVAALAACALGATSVASLAMAVSLALPRMASALLVLGAVAAVAVVNAASLFGASLEGAAAALDRFGPPLATAMVVALEPWLDGARVDEAGALVTLRLLAWAVAGVGLLVALVRRVDLSG